MPPLPVSFTTRSVFPDVVLLPANDGADMRTRRKYYYLKKKDWGLILRLVHTLVENINSALFSLYLFSLFSLVYYIYNYYATGKATSSANALQHRLWDMRSKIIRSLAACTRFNNTSLRIPKRRPVTAPCNACQRWSIF